jgi:hypothetical protein
MGGQRGRDELSTREPEPISVTEMETDEILSAEKTYEAEADENATKAIT